MAIPAVPGREFRARWTDLEGGVLLRQQFRGSHPQGNGKLLDNDDRRIAGAALDIGDICAVDVRLERELLLAPALLLAQTAQIAGKTKTDIHAGHEPDCRQSIYRR